MSHQTANSSDSNRPSASGKPFLSGEFFAVASAVLFGCMPLITRIAYRYGSNAFMASIGRYSSGAVWIALLVFLQNRRGVPGMTLRIGRREFFELFGLSFLSGGTGVLLYASYNYISSGLATTLHYSYPVIIMVLSAVLFRALIRKAEVISLLLCVAGILLLYTPGGDIRPLGIFIALMSGFVYAFFCVLFERSRSKALPALVSTFWLSLFSTVQIICAAFAFAQFIPDLPLRAHLAHILLGFVASALAAVFYQRALQLCGSIRTSMLSTLEPVTSIIVGYFVFMEMISLRSAAGILCILGACLLLVLKTQNTGEARTG